jgi:hypothetical protein
MSLRSIQTMTLRTHLFITLMPLLAFADKYYQHLKISSKYKNEVSRINRDAVNIIKI